MSVVRDLTGLQARWVLRLIRETGAPFKDLALRQTPWKGELPAAGDAWDRFVEQAEKLLVGTAGEDSEDRRVERFLDFAITAFRAPRPPNVERPPADVWQGCFCFHQHPSEEMVSLHVRNHCAPHSPFEDIPACFRYLRALCESVTEMPFAVRKLHCGTWLNDLPFFLGFFPPSYRRNLVASTPDWRNGGGWWGQFVDKTGQLNRKRAAMLIETGQFAHKRKESWCDFQEFREHVAKARQVKRGATGRVRPAVRR